MVLNKLPDIDIDFAVDRKDGVVDLIFDKYGEHAAIVGGFNTFRGRSAFADIAKVMGVSEYQVRRMTERIPWTDASHVEEAVAYARNAATGPSRKIHTERRCVWLIGLMDFPAIRKCIPAGWFSHACR
jgi:DNA polymerase III alpha subunit